MKTSTLFFYVFLGSIAALGLGGALGCDLCTCPGGLFILGGLLGGLISLPGWIIAGISELVNAKKAKLLAEQSSSTVEHPVESPPTAPPVDNIE